MRRRFDPTLYLVTDPELARGRALTEVVSAAVRGGVTLVQLRDKHAGGRALLEAARALKTVLEPQGVPLLVNDRADVWADMWRLQVQLGAVPFYMFVERDTGPKNYFEVPLARSHEIFCDAYRRVSGLARTVRGPSMSAIPGKVVVDGVTEIAGRHAICTSLRITAVIAAGEPW